MAPDEYVALWKDAASEIREAAPEARIYVGGLFKRADWIRPILDRLDPVPDGIDLHYPDDEDALRSAAELGLPLSVMEWNYVGRRVTAKDVAGWIEVLERWCADWGWYCWKDGSYMGLVGPSDRPRKSWRDLRDALRLLGPRRLQA